jgi:hypothetical protein
VQRVGAGDQRLKVPGEAAEADARRVLAVRDHPVAVGVELPFRRGLRRRRLPNLVGQEVEQLVDRDDAVLVPIASPDFSPSTSARVKTEGSGSPTRFPLSNAYWTAFDAVMTTRPLPWRCSLMPGVSTPTLWIIPAAKAPPKQQSRKIAIRCDRQSFISCRQPVGVERRRLQEVDLGVGRGQVELAGIVLQAMAREMDEEQVVPIAAGEERFERLPKGLDLCV